jgi:hypothetical protein
VFFDVSYKIRIGNDDSQVYGLCLFAKIYFLTRFLHIFHSSPIYSTFRLQTTLMDQVSTLKKQGNDAFKAGDLDQAADLYLQAINLTNDGVLLATLYSNRAQVFLNQQK